MSQTDLAASLGISFQQVQKYENGANRISIGRLANIADLLGVSITFLLTGSEEKRGQREADETTLLLEPAGALQLIKAYDRMKNPMARQAFVDLVESIAGKRKRTSP